MLFVIQFCFFNFGLFSQELLLQEILDDEVIKKLLENESYISLFYRKDKNIESIAPKVGLIEEAKKTWQKTHEIEPLISIEGLFLYEKPQQKDEKKDFTTNSLTSIEKTINVFTGISKMKGMEYYSERKKKNQILYEDFYVVDAYETQKRIPDPRVNSLENLHILVSQKDTTFGSYIMNVDYFQKGSELAMYMKNLDPLKYLLINAIQVDNLHLYLYTKDLDEHILIYILVQASYLDISLLNQTVEKSLLNRIDAIYNWFKIQYGGKN